MTRIRQCPARECDNGIFTYKVGPSTGKTRVCYRCKGKGTVDLDAEKAEKIRLKHAETAANMLREECRKRTGRIKSRLEDDVEIGIMSLEQNESDRLPKLWDSVHAGRLDACISALVEYGKANPLR